MVGYRKIFTDGLNADDDFSLVGKNQWINASAVRVGTTDKGSTGPVEVVGGNAVVFNLLPDGNNICIGGCADETRKRILFGNWNSNGDHAIYCWDKIANLTYTVLLDSQVTGGLNFSKYLRIDSNAKMIGDLFAFTDFNNEPRRINVEAGIKLNQGGYTTPVAPYASPLAYTTLTLVKRPPIYPLNFVKFLDSGFANNYILNEAYQITYRYRYRDYDISALAAFSHLVPYNFKEEGSNAVTVSLSFSEHIDDDVFAIDVCVKYGNNGKIFIVKTWDKDTDLTAINAHNAQSAVLSFVFHDDLRGEALGDIESVTSEDDVPLLTKTIELGKDRLFHGFVKKGYDVPKANNLSLSLTTIDTGSTGSFTGKWGYVTLHANFCHDPGLQDTYMYPFVLIDSGQGEPHDFYYFPGARSSTIWDGGVGLVPPVVNMADATFAGDTEAAMITYLKFSQYPHSPSGIVVCFPTWLDPYDIVYADPGLGNVTVNEFAPAISVQQFFKSGGAYIVNIAFYDRFRRKCGTLKNGVRITIPERAYTQTTFNSAIQWQLDNTNALTEIPDWAFYYQIHITRDLITRFFVQARANGSQYATKALDGTLSYGPTYAFLTTYAIAIDVTNLANYGLGYSFTQGDMIKLYTTEPLFYLLRVIGTDGNYVLCMPENIGTLPRDLLFELYTPYRPLTTEPIYETGPVYPIANPETALRTYTTLTDIINGDCYALSRPIDMSTSYIAETMSPNDLMWQNWQTDTGWENEYDSIGQKLLKESIVFSDTYIQGTKINGLNKYQPLNETDLDSENGPISKLQLANKVQLDGSVLLAITEEECVSIYLGVQELFDTNGSAFVAKADGVIGSFKALKGSNGTSNPESVFEYNGLVFWWDTRNGGPVQYANNGLFMISKNKLVRAAELFSKKFVSLSQAEIEDLGSYPFIIAGFDPYHKEVLFSIPSTEATPPKGYLQDYPTRGPMDTFSFNAGSDYTGSSKGILTTTIVSGGTGYTNGTYNGVPVSSTSGTGSNAAANVTVAGGIVTAFVIVTEGKDYNPGDSIFIPDGNMGGTPATQMLIQVDTVESPYSAIPLVGGAGSGAVADIYVYNGSIYRVVITDPGVDYEQDDVLTAIIGEAGSGFDLTILSITGTKIIYPYDIYDGIGKTLVYKHEKDQWHGSHPYQAEMFMRMDSDLYSFKDGALYVHNQDSAANFYGVQHTAKLMFSNNPGAIHTFRAMGLECNKTPSFVHLRTEDPYVQSSDLPYEGVEDFVSKEGVIEASILRDRLSPNAEGDYDSKQLIGDQLFGKALLTMLEWEFEEDETKLSLKFSNIGHTLNTGTLLNKQQ